MSELAVNIRPTWGLSMTIAGFSKPRNPAE